MLVEVGKHIYLTAATDTSAVPPDLTPSNIVINASGNGSNGVAYIHGSKGVSLTSGGASVGLENNQDVNGNITLQCGPLGTISLRRDLVTAPNLIQNISMDSQEGSELITIDGGLNGAILLQSGKFFVIGGSQITLDPNAGIELQCGNNLIQIQSSGITMGTYDQQNLITIDETGVTINAVNITLNAKVKTASNALQHNFVSPLGKLGITLAQHTG